MQVQLEVVVQGAGAVVGQAGVFVEEVVDVGGLVADGFAAHHQHTLDDAVGAVAVGEDAIHIFGEVAEDVLQEIQLFVVQLAVLVFVQGFFHFHEEFAGGFGEVFDEVEGVADFVGDAGGEFAEGGEFLLGDDAVLGGFQVFESLFQFYVFALEFLGQDFHEVEALDFQGVLAEDFQGGGHIGDFVAAVDIDLGFQVAAGHAAHPAGEEGEAAEEDAADVEPADDDGADDADDADGQQEPAAGDDGLAGGVGGFLGAQAGGADEVVHFADQGYGDGAVVGEEVILAGFQFQVALAQVKAVLRAGAEVDEALEDGGQVGVQDGVGAFQVVQVAVDLPGGGFESFPQGFDQPGFGEG